MDPGTHDAGTTGGDDEPSLAVDRTVVHLHAASRMTDINTDARTGTKTDADAGTGTGTGTGIRTGNNNALLGTNPASTSLPREHQKCYHNFQDGAARLLYTRFVSMFQHKDKDRDIRNTIFPTPPASPDIRHRNVYALAPSSFSPLLDQQPPTCGPASAVVDSEISDPPALWTPLTPDSFDHHHSQYSGRTRSDVWTKLDRLSQELFVSSVDSENTQPALPYISGTEDLQLHTRGTGDVSDTGLGASLYLSPRVDSAGPDATADPRHQKEIVHGHANHVTEGIQLGEDGEGSVRRSGSVKWGKTRALPIVRRVGFS
jgi:hypothetical protein